jgi:hypothetical protein
MDCESMCAAIWAAGHDRFVGNDAHLGFHTVYMKVGHGKREKDVPSKSGNEMMTAYYTYLGLSKSTIAYLIKAAPNDMAWLTQEKATELGIVAETFPKPEADTKQADAKPAVVLCGSFGICQAKASGPDHEREYERDHGPNAKPVACGSEDHSNECEYERAHSANAQPIQHGITNLATPIGPMSELVKQMVEAPVVF